MESAPKQSTTPSPSSAVNKYNDPTLPGYDPSKPVGTLMEAAPKQSTTPSPSSAVNKYNDPTLPGYDPSKPVGTLMEAAPKQTSTASYKTGSNKFNDPTLPDFDPNWEERMEEGTYKALPKRGPNTSYYRGYFYAPKL